MKLKSLAIIGLAALSITACTKCSKESQELDETKKLLEQIPDAAKNIQDQANATQNLQSARKQKGDTMAIAAKDLVMFLPNQIPGYRAESPNCESLNFGDAITYSQVTYVFKGGSGNIEIVLADYNSAAELYTSQTLWSAGMDMSNDQGYQKTFNPNIANTMAYEIYDKASKSAVVQYGVAGRFFASVKVDNQSNTDFAKKVAAMINIAELAKK